MSDPVTRPAHTAPHVHDCFAGYPLKGWDPCGYCGAEPGDTCLEWKRYEPPYRNAARAKEQP